MIDELKDVGLLTKEINSSKKDVLSNNLRDPFTNVSGEIHFLNYRISDRFKRNISKWVGLPAGQQKTLTIPTLNRVWNELRSSSGWSDFEITFDPFTSSALTLTPKQIPKVDMESLINKIDPEKVVSVQGSIVNDDKIRFLTKSLDLDIQGDAFYAGSDVTVAPFGFAPTQVQHILYRLICSNGLIDSADFSTSIIDPQKFDQDIFNDIVDIVSKSDSVFVKTMTQFVETAKTFPISEPFNETLNSPEIKAFVSRTVRKKALRDAEKISNEEDMDIFQNVGLGSLEFLFDYVSLLTYEASLMKNIRSRMMAEIMAFVWATSFLTRANVNY